MHVVLQGLDTPSFDTPELAGEVGQRELPDLFTPGLMANLPDGHASYDSLCDSPSPAQLSFDEPTIALVPRAQLARAGAAAFAATPDFLGTMPVRIDEEDDQECTKSPVLAAAGASGNALGSPFSLPQGDAAASPSASPSSTSAGAEHPAAASTKADDGVAAVGEQQTEGVSEQADSAVDVEDVKVDVPAADSAPPSVGDAGSVQEDKQEEGNSTGSADDAPAVLAEEPVVAGPGTEESCEEPSAAEPAFLGADAMGGLTQPEASLPTSCRAQSPTSSQAAADSTSRSSSCHSIRQEAEEAGEQERLAVEATAAAVMMTEAAEADAGRGEDGEGREVEAGSLETQEEAAISGQEDTEVSRQQLELIGEGKEGGAGGRGAEQEAGLAEEPAPEELPSVAAADGEDAGEEAVEEQQNEIQSAAASTPMPTEVVEGQQRCTEQPGPAAGYEVEAAEHGSTVAEPGVEDGPAAGAIVGLGDAEQAADATTPAESTAATDPAEAAAGGADPQSATESGLAAFAVQLGPEDSGFSAAEAEEEQDAAAEALVEAGNVEASADTDTAADEGLGVAAERSVDALAAGCSSSCISSQPSAAAAIREEPAPEQDLADAPFVGEAADSSDERGVAHEITEAADQPSESGMACLVEEDGVGSEAGEQTLVNSAAKLNDSAAEPLEAIAGDEDTSGGQGGTGAKESDGPVAEGADAAAPAAAEEQAAEELPLEPAASVSVELQTAASAEALEAMAEGMVTSAAAAAGQHCWGSEEGEDGSKGQHGIASGSSALEDSAKAAPASEAESAGGDASIGADTADQELVEEMGGDGLEAPVCRECSSPGLGESSGLTENELGSVGGDDLLVSEEGDDLLLPLPSRSSTSVAAGGDSSLQPSYCEEPEVLDDAEVVALCGDGSGPEGVAGGGGGDVGGVHHHHRRQPLCLVRESLPLFSQVMRNSQVVKESSLDDEDLSLLGGRNEGPALEGVQEGVEEDEETEAASSAAAAGDAGPAGLGLRGTSGAAGAGGRLLHRGGAQRVLGVGHQSHFVSSLEPVVEAPSPDRWV